jgi:hypothetical protein
MGRARGPPRLDIASFELDVQPAFAMRVGMGAANVAIATQIERRSRRGATPAALTVVSESVRNLTHA